MFLFILKKKYISLLFWLIFIQSFSVYAQDDYQKWLKQQNEKFKQFKDERDKAFADFLQKEWKKMQMTQGLVPDEEPKPIDIPVAEFTDLPENIISDSLHIIEEIKIPEPEPVKEPDVEIAPIVPKVENAKELNFQFFGAPIYLNYDNDILVDIDGKINKEKIGSFWTTLSKSDFEPVQEQIEALKTKMDLNDWGICFLLFQIGKNVYNENKQSILFTWFMLSKLGYKVKVGYFNNDIFLLIPSKQVLFEITYFEIDKQRYYAINFDKKQRELESLYTYDGNYPGAETVFDFNINNPPGVGNIETNKELQFKFNNQNFTFLTKYNKNAIDYFSHYPHTTLDVYFNSSPSDDIAYSLLSNLKSMVEGKSETEAVNILLRFVQTAFQYQTDAEQFGIEKYLFSEETVFYPYSDCEDRSILFSFLVRQLIGLEVIGLDYPGHVATAVKFNADVNGDSIIYQNQKYLICDPTYINANIGLCMPQFKNIKPEFIVIKE